jgi:DNA-binding MarR family transcriptional regulator
MLLGCGAVSDELHHRLLLSMLRAEHEVVKACNRVYRRFGVTYHQFQVLRILETADEPLTQGTIGAHLLVSRANLSGLIDRMVDNRLVRRRISRKDRRVVLVNLTDRGRERLSALAPVRDSVESILLAGITPAAADELIAVLDGVAGRAEELG